MSKRIKTLAVIVGALVAVLVLVLVARVVVLKPVRAMDVKISAARDRLNKLKTERAEYMKAREFVIRVAQSTFADTNDQASAKSGELLTRLIVQSGLREADFTRMPVGPRLLQAGIKTGEIGWNVHGEGKLDNVLNLIFQLQETPYLHRIDNLSISGGDGPGRVSVSFRFLTLVVQPSPPFERTELEAKLTLQSPERRLYDAIAARDLLRPYIKRPPPEVVRRGPGQNTAAQAPPTPPGPESLRVVSLSEWMGQPEVHVRDQASQKTLRFKPGDSFGGGTIVMVDYRPLPLPGNEALKSFSRVILKIGSDFWAIERGKTLADKYRLNPEQLPENLSKL